MFIKNNLVVLSFTCVIIALLFNTTISTHKTVAQPYMKDFDNAFLGIKIKYPSDWTGLYSYYGVIFFPPTMDASTLDSARVFVERPTDISIPLDQLVPQLSNIYYASKKDFDPISLKYYTSNTLSLFYTYTDPTFGKTEAFDVFRNLNGKLSAIHYSASPSSYSRYSPVFFEMLKSYYTPISTTQPYIPPYIPPTQPDSDCFNTDLDVSDMLLSCASESGHTMSPEESTALSNMIKNDHETNTMIINNIR